MCQELMFLLPTQQLVVCCCIGQLGVDVQWKRRMHGRGNMDLLPTAYGLVEFTPWCVEQFMVSPEAMASTSTMMISRSL